MPTVSTYAKVLDQATTVFGTQALAEEWMARPCKHLGGEVPKDMLSDPERVQAVADYLSRIEHGVYQ